MALDAILYILGLVFIWIAVASFVGIIRFSYLPLAFLGFGELLVGAGLFGLATDTGFRIGSHLPYWEFTCFAVGLFCNTIFQIRNGMRTLRSRGINLQKLLFFTKS